MLAIYHSLGGVMWKLKSMTVLYQLKSTWFIFIRIVEKTERHQCKILYQMLTFWREVRTILWENE